MFIYGEEKSFSECYYITCNVSYNIIKSAEKTRNNSNNNNKIFIKC